MRVTDRDHRPECHVIPFQRPEIQAEEVAATSISAVIAVTVLHISTDSPADLLLTIFEQSGAAEGLDAEDALRDCEPGFSELEPIPANATTHTPTP